jgi:hypothetical protein
MVEIRANSALHVGVLDAVGLMRRWQRTRGQLRTLATIATQLTRIADALERESPPPATGLTEVEVEELSAKQQAAYDMVAMAFFRREGREPEADELLREYDQHKHLFE